MEEMVVLEEQEEHQEQVNHQVLQQLLELVVMVELGAMGQAQEEWAAILEAMAALREWAA